MRGCSWQEKEVVMAGQATGNGAAFLALRLLGLLAMLMFTLAAAPASAPMPSRWMDPLEDWRPHLAPAPGPAAGSAKLVQKVSAATAGDGRRQQGRIAILVEPDVYADVSVALATYAADLGQVGFSSTVTTISGNAEYLRNTLITLYNEPDSLVGAVLIGELPYVIYEMNQDWGDGSEYEDFPCDLYFMDMNGTWTDQLNDPPVQANNGKLDTWSGDRNLEIWVSRMRTGNLASLGAEADILNTYLARNHVVRRSVLNNLHLGLVYDDDDWQGMGTGDESNLEEVFGIGNVITITDPEATTATDYIDQRLTAGYHLDLIRSHGSPNGHGFYRNGRTVFEYVWREQYTIHDPAAVFFSLFVCSGCDYTASNYLGGTVVFNPQGSSLLAWGSTKTGGMLYDHHLYDRIAAGDCVGEAFRYWFNQIKNYSFAPRWWYGMVLIGDGSCHTRGDCNGNGISDQCDVDCELPGCDVSGCGESLDCNGNGFPDECDLDYGTSADCNSNEVPDECDVAGPTSEDCNDNMVPDDCEPQEDCNDNGVQDICDIAGPTSEDCNENIIPDECDIVLGTSQDGNENGVPDECDDCNGNQVLDMLESPVVLFQNAGSSLEALDTTAPVAQDLHLLGWALVRQFTVHYRSTGSTPGVMMVRFFEGSSDGGVVPVYPDGLIGEYDCGPLPWTNGDPAYQVVDLEPGVWIPSHLWMEVEIEQDAGVILRSDPTGVGYTQGLVYDRQAGALLPEGPRYMSLRMLGVQCAPSCTCGDIDGSGGPVDLGDFAVLANCFGLTGPTPSCGPAELACCDLDLNGVVDLNDFATFATLYGLISSNLPPNCQE